MEERRIGNFIVRDGLYHGLTATQVMERGGYSLDEAVSLLVKHGEDGVRKILESKEKKHV